MLSLFFNLFCILHFYYIAISNTFFNCQYLCGNIANRLELHIDDRNKNEDLLYLEPDGLLLLNIASYAAGANPWQGNRDGFCCAASQSNDDRFRSQSCSDGYLEVIGFKHFELAHIQLGRRGHQIGQG